MSILPNISSFLIGFSYSFLLYNKIAFGISLVVGTIILMIYKKCLTLNIFNQKKEFNFILISLIVLFLISCGVSIEPDRSVLVVIYFFLFLLLSSNLNLCFNLDKEIFEKTLFFFTISIVLNITYICFYNLYQSGILKGTFFEINFSGSEGEFFLYEIMKFKGVMNIISILVLLLPFFRNSSNYFYLILLLIPSLILSNSNSSILGILSGIILCLFLFIVKKTKKQKQIIISFFALGIITLSILIKNLPTQLESESIKNYDFKIPISLIDAHRQFIWAFSITRIKDKALFGYGPDTSNFIEGSQEIIGNYYTGTMKYIPSHPHNFLLELMLEVGIFGTTAFIIFIILLNFNIFKISNIRQQYFLIFFNGYFWGASLVNFSFWLGWWQGSYFFILALIYSKIYLDEKL
tara:strand:+ start:385 stop:1605 length:1221 start_codon:yes stop_codon:yes gene_type:complete